MLWVVIIFLGLSLFLYCLLGGADFGAGALEIFFPSKNREKYREIVMKAMGPVWEANHIWLIILIVILFNGFPKAYAGLSIYFHIPLTLMLLGIILRGCAFTFRSYDALRDQSRELYSRVFSFASLLTPVMFGMIVGGLMLGEVDPHNPNYFSQYISPWMNLFCLAVGFFVLSIFMFVAAVFLTAEAKDAQTIFHFTRQAKYANFLMVCAGAVVFFLAEFRGHPLLRIFLTNPLSLTAFLFATAALIAVWKNLRCARPWALRILVGFQLSMILLAWFAGIFPNILTFKNGDHLTLLNTAAPPLTLTILGWSLMIGAAFFLPALYYLIVIFKVQDRSVPESQKVDFHAE